MGLSIQQETGRPNSVTMVLAGQIDGGASAKLDQEIGTILRQGTRTIILDMAGVDFMSSAGVGVIMKAKTSLTARNGDLATIHLQPQVEKVFEIMALLPAMNVVKNTEELDEYLAKVQRRMTEDGSFSDD